MTLHDQNLFCLGQLNVEQNEYYIDIHGNIYSLRSGKLTRMHGDDQGRVNLAGRRVRKDVLLVAMLNYKLRGLLADKPIKTSRVTRDTRPAAFAHAARQHVISGQASTETLRLLEEASHIILRLDDRLEQTRARVLRFADDFKSSIK